MITTTVEKLETINLKGLNKNLFIAYLVDNLKKENVLTLLSLNEQFFESLFMDADELLFVKKEQTVKNVISSNFEFTDSVENPFALQMVERKVLYAYNVIPGFIDVKKTIGKHGVTEEKKVISSVTELQANFGFALLEDEESSLIMNKKSKVITFFEL